MHEPFPHESTKDDQTEFSPKIQQTREKITEHAKSMSEEKRKTKEATVGIELKRNRSYGI